MKKPFQLFICLLLVSGMLALSGCVDDTPATSDTPDTSNINQSELQNDILYQVSTIDALLEGLYDGQLSMGELKEQGDLGLGTFDALDGEMIVIDGEVYQMKTDGYAYSVDDSVTTPFAAVTYFETDEAIVLNGPSNSSEVALLVGESLPSKNLMYAIRIDGTFEHMKVRSVPAQEEPYPLLVDVIAVEQAVFELENVEGSIVGFWLPYYVEGINVPGYHFHFIDTDREKGGHVLDYTILNGTVYIDQTAGFELSLPESAEFMDVDLLRDKGDELHTVEKDDE
ncbi:alpha-acetolactate decarboxylase [Methanococcoides methylutens]|uniref:Alpha-acetolactate decarboxylase n=1 Tax=Methanococcoides methylutens TaxID=2226 RepID=A0A099T0S0_METMT|nr:acetolactate decarboxylase [Methanococcoides methylutens]KGK97816.1 alpha-acetolactate decarboxylase [Methanococcoides methylutens]